VTFVALMTKLKKNTSNMHSPYACVRPCVCFNLKNVNWSFVHFDITQFNYYFFFWRSLILVNIEHNNRKLDVKTYARFCAHFERRSLNINQSEECCEQKF